MATATTRTTFNTMENYNDDEITKPKTSRNCNSEKYFICYNFKGVSIELLESIRTIIENYIIDINTNNYTIIYPDINLNQFNELKKIKLLNNLIIHEQIKTINESLKIVNCKDYYFQNLLLNLFSENKLTESEKSTISVVMKLIPSLVDLAAIPSFILR